MSLPNISPIIPQTNFSTEHYVLGLAQLTFPPSIGATQISWGTFTQGIRYSKTVEIRNASNCLLGLSFLSQGQEVLYLDIPPDEVVTLSFPDSAPIDTLKGRFSYLSPFVETNQPTGFIGVLYIFTSNTVVDIVRQKTENNLVTVPVMYTLGPAVALTPATLIQAVGFIVSISRTGAQSQGNPTFGLGPFRKCYLYSTTGASIGTNYIVTKGISATSFSNSVTITSTGSLIVPANQRIEMGDNIQSIQVSGASIGFCAECRVLTLPTSVQIVDP